MTKIILPELGEGITHAKVACWHFQEGDRVCEGDDVVELVTDKASFNVSANCSGVLQNILVEEGKEAEIGAVLAVIKPERN